MRWWLAEICIWRELGGRKNWIRGWGAFILRELIGRGGIVGCVSAGAGVRRGNGELGSDRTPD